MTRRAHCVTGGDEGADGACVCRAGADVHLFNDCFRAASISLFLSAANSRSAFAFALYHASIFKS